MRVYFKREDGSTTVIEIIQMIRYRDENNVGLAMPYSQYCETKGFNFYKSTTAPEEREYNQWCEQLMRTGYLDLTRSNLVFKAYKA